MNNSLWFVKHKNILRWMILILLAISMMGPWSFDLINVPAEYACSAPIVRLYGDFCGVPLSGVQVFGLFIGGFFYMLLEMEHLDEMESMNRILDELHLEDATVTNK